jgi:hypothetical protein
MRGTGAVPLVVVSPEWPPRLAQLALLQRCSAHLREDDAEGDVQLGDVVVHSPDLDVLHRLPGGKRQHALRGLRIGAQRSGHSGTIDYRFAQ